MMRKDDVLVAKIGAPHGIKGQLRVQSFTQDPKALVSYDTLRDKHGISYTIDNARLSKNMLIVSFAQVRTREQAEALNGTALYVTRDQLGDDTLEEDEFFIHDLVGLAARDKAGAQIGTVVAVHNFGADDVLEIADMAPDGSVSTKTSFYPFSKAVVPHIDMANASLTLVPPNEIIVPPEGSKERDDDPDADGEP